MKRRREREIAPDEIFLDAANVNDFDRSRLEGRLERPLSRSAFAAAGLALGAFALVLLAQAGNLELRQGRAYAAESAQNSLEATTLFAERGVIEDRNGVPLATNSSTPENGFDARVYKSPGFGALLGYVSYPKKDANGNYYDTQEKGVAGVEQEFDAELAGKNGTLLVEKDALGDVESQGSVVPAQNGKTLTLSIDSKVQDALYQAVKNVSDSVGFIGGAGVIMNAKTGEVLALVSYPEYDPNVLSAGAPAATIAGYASDPGHPYLDRALGGVYTPGSVVKPFEAAGALTDGVITADTAIDDPGELTVPNPYDPAHPNVFTSWKALGLLDVEQAIAWSSDVFFYTVGGGHGPIKGLGIDRLDYWYQQFGLASTTGIELPGEVAGLLPTPAWKQQTFGQAWNIGDTYHTAIGQYSMQVTPLALARAIAAVANGGKLVTPTVLAGQPVRESAVPASPDSLAETRAGMRLGVTLAGGLASPLDLPYVSVAAKTGTAQVGAQNQYDNSWAEGFWPYEDPEYAFAVVLERGPSGAGEESVNVMQEALETLHRSAPEYFQ
ncbi:MAG TPA: penicillin-binding transpeptidase domain-containing protein [Candidatus Paceibacterota bacterium]|nr:penicillin-binding transpeptidase domain-containing protein [Candidatus Paceibacterota bacterium]